MFNWKIKALSIAIGLSVLAPTASFAADTAIPTEAPLKKKAAHTQRLNAEQCQAMHDKMLDLVDSYAPETMDRWENALAERKKLMEELKENYRLSDEEKEKLQAIREELKNGTITREQAREEAQELGIDKIRKHKLNYRLSDEEKEKLQAIREELKNGTITREQAREEVQKLNLGAKAGLVFQLHKAVKDGDDSAIKELLPQLLNQLEEKNQQLSDRLADIN